VRVEVVRAEVPVVETVQLRQPQRVVAAVVGKELQPRQAKATVVVRELERHQAKATVAVRGLARRLVKDVAQAVGKTPTSSSLLGL
jgi:hypothetical protein